MYVNQFTEKFRSTKLIRLFNLLKFYIKFCTDRSLTENRDTQSRLVPILEM
jgi:hypothetical protein